ncbi:MAG: hypothetical protein ACF788_06150 [Novipirellula sp. JB048]
MDYSTIIATLTKTLLLLGLLIGLAPAGGCRICAEGEDLAYPAYGGAWQRTRRDAGRVGSLFDPAGARAPELVRRDQPLSADEEERAMRARLERSEQQTDDSPPDTSPDLELPQPADPRSDSDEDLRRREQELRDMDLDEIRVIRGEPEPPTST